MRNLFAGSIPDGRSGDGEAKSGNFHRPAVTGLCVAEESDFIDAMQIEVRAAFPAAFFWQRRRPSLGRLLRPWIIFSAICHNFRAGPKAERREADHHAEAIE
jgi:hypothetical protein